MKSQVKVSDLIGPGHPLFITAEVGITCNGDLYKAKALIDAAADAGADAVKFMIIDPDNNMADRNVMYNHTADDGPHTVTMYEMFKGFHFSMSEWQQIRDYADAEGILFYLTVDTLLGLSQGEELKCPMYKLSSWDIVNTPLIVGMAKTGKPIQLDLGPAEFADIVSALNWISPHNEDIILIHATHAIDMRESNMRSIAALRTHFARPVGWSADSRNEAIDMIALGCGIDLIEKRITLDKTDPGHHHNKALEPSEFKLWVSNMHAGHKTAGAAEIRPSSEDLRQSELWYPSIVADVDIPRGTVLSPMLLAAKRPGHGIRPGLIDSFVGRKASANIRKNTLLGWHNVERD